VTVVLEREGMSEDDIVAWLGSLFVEGSAD
jgi:hypothetical protein